MGHMANREQIQASSSRRPEACSGHRHASPKRRSVGCMSGILRLLSRHHSRSHKRLANVPKKDESVSSPSKPPIPQKNEAVVLSKIDPYHRRSSCELAPRSPTIPSDLRKSGSSCSLESPRRSSAIVARLMGLESPAAAVAEAPQPQPPDSAAEKRRRLLGALEKCDEDLKTLKRIIEAVRLAEIRMKALETVGSGGKGLDGRDLMMEMEQPSPNSVLDAISSPRFRSKRTEGDKRCDGTSVGLRFVKPSRMGVIFGDHWRMPKDNYTGQRCIIYRTLPIEGLPRVGLWSGTESSSQRDRRPRQRASRSIVESVEEIWEEGVWEERWERERLGVGLESVLFGGLVEELVLELFTCCCKLSLSLRSCRKRLYF